MSRPQVAPDPTAGSLESAPRLPAAPAGAGADGAPARRVGCGSRDVLGTRVDATSYAEAAEAIARLATASGGGMVCVATVHMIMEAFDDPAFRRILNAADLVTPDGVPLVWALRLLGIPEAQRVYGPSLTPVVCRRAEKLDIPVGFYGGTRQTLDALLGRLSARFPRLRIAFASSPPFRPLTLDEDREVTGAIEASGAQILFVGLGCPKQERWMASHRTALPCAMVGVGAAFDFLAGTKRQAPGWIQRAGLEWLYRLIAEPRRLWRRYLVGNPRFLYHFAIELARARRDGRARAGRARERP